MRSSAMRGSGAVDGMLSGWTKEALCVILDEPRAEREERSRVHDGMKNVKNDMRKMMKVFNRVGVGGWLGRRQDIFPQVIKPTEASRMASG